MHIVPFNGSRREHFVFRVGRHAYELDIWWQPQTESWHVTIALDNEVLCTGERINPGVPLLRTGDPENGELIAVPVATDAEYPGVDGWGDEFVLVHFDPREIRLLSQ